MRQAAREENRRDLIALGSAQTVAQSLAESLEGAEAAAFAPPRVPGRKQTIGWYWWRTEKRPDGTLVRSNGWALTYRRARRRAGVPLVGASTVEFVLRPKA